MRFEFLLISNLHVSWPVFEITRRLSLCRSPSSVGLLVYVLKNSTICDFHFELPNDAICFHNKKMHKFRFRLLKGQLLVQKKLKAIPMKKNVWEANCIMGVLRNSQMARCLASHLLVHVIRPFFKKRPWKLAYSCYPPYSVFKSCNVRFIKIAYCSIAHVRGTEMLHE